MEEVGILYGIVGRVQAECRIDCVEHSRENEGPTQRDWLCLDVWEVMIFVKSPLSLALTRGVMVTSASSCHPCRDFYALLAEGESDFVADTHRAQYLLVESMVFLQVIEGDHTFRDLVK